ncbi:MAG: hypothetical protein KC636_33260 [Myxococcales bacterium]|nr:hypothetical protein [Myxococcales bacterium]
MPASSPAAPLTHDPATPTPVAAHAHGVWYELDAGTADAHVRTFVMSVASGHVVIRTRSVISSAISESMTTVPGTLHDLGLDD